MPAQRSATTPSKAGGRRGKAAASAGQGPEERQQSRGALQTYDRHGGSHDSHDRRAPRKQYEEYDSGGSAGRQHYANKDYNRSTSQKGVKQGHGGFDHRVFVNSALLEAGGGTPQGGGGGGGARQKDWKRGSSDPGDSMSKQGQGRERQSSEPGAARQKRGQGRERQASEPPDRDVYCEYDYYQEEGTGQNRRCASKDYIQHMHAKSGKGKKKKPAEIESPDSSDVGDENDYFDGDLQIRVEEGRSLRVVTAERSGPLTRAGTTPSPPPGRYKTPNVQSPWMTEEIRRGIKTKKKLLRKMKKTDSVKDVEKFKKFRNELSGKIRNAKQDYYDSLDQDGQSQSRY